MPKVYKFLLLILFATASSIAFSQTVSAEESDGVMRSAGKIYVVLAIVLTIFAGLIFYVIRLDRKITRLEKENIN